MTKKEFLRAVSNGKEDIIQIFLDVLKTSKSNKMKIPFDDIENAFMFVSMGPRFANEAILCKWCSENGIDLVG